jgi:hypothetical protein
MTLTELRYVVAVAAERHFGRAAERCFVSQPSLSAAVKNLEGELGVQIFERGKGEVLVTPIGEEVIAQAKRALGKEHLTGIGDFFQSGHAIRNFRSSDKVRFGDRKVTSKPMVQFAIRSTALCDALLAHGMCVKSLTREASTALMDSRDFWRGLVDGDGYVGTTQDGKPRLGLCGGRVLMMQFLDFIRRHHIKTVAAVRHEKKIFRVDLNCTPAIECARLLYQDAGVALDRKNSRVRDILNTDR